ncbi:hypothetical protein [Streptomyces sp. NBC_01320]|uniref:hypothetical protein n=1 Tax=Streptomyces sp. NBC_01320 TaxID=2903824 RepID=UPI002E108FDE|nr:hypothetical protein OG395_04050 [Streptomyces sp. NBC_01320]
MPHMFRTPAMPHWAEFATLLATIYVSDRLCSLTVANQFAHWNQWVRPLPFALASTALLVFVVMPGAARLWTARYTAASADSHPMAGR